MIIWTAMFIPLLAIIILAIFFNKKMAWWEYLLVLAVPALIILGIKSGVESAQVRCTEYWGAYLTKGAYYEDWDEWITETCYREVPCGTDAHGNTKWCSESYDCSHSEYHPAYWEVTNSIGETFHVDSAYFEKLCKLWGKRDFLKMNRDYYTKDGNAYTTAFDSVLDHTIPTTTKHVYENRVQASHSIFNFREFKKGEASKLGLYDHPGIDGFSQGSILGPLSTDPNGRYIEYVNAYAGRPSKVKVFILSWVGKPEDISFQQEAYWKGGNKNEVVVCIGLNADKTIEWCRVFGWSKNEQMKIEVRNFVMAQINVPLDVLAQLLTQQFEHKIIRRDFREFSYLTVDPPTTAVVWTFILTILLCAGLGWFSVENEFDRDDPSGKNNY